MSKPTITIIGAGSAHWMPGILTDMALTPALHGSRLVLHDIDPVALDLITSLSSRIFQQAGVEFAVESTTELRPALKGADYVVVTVGVGGLEAMRRDLEVPAKYGVTQSVGDTVGPGGVARALRHIPVIVDIAREMEQQCPNAWMLNYTNPMTTLCRAATKATSIKTIGLCHELGNVLRFLQTLFQVEDPADLQYSVAGINHLIWLVELRIRGEDGFELLRRYLQEHGAYAHIPSVLPGTSESVFQDRYAVKFELFKTFGALPAVNDRHISEFFPYFLTPEAQFGAPYGVELTTMVHRYERVGRERAAVQAMVEGEQQIALKKTKEEIAEILAALITRKDEVHVLNLPNRGQIGDLPAGAVVETLGVVGAQGACGLAVGALTPGVLSTLSRHVLVQEITVDAALKGDRDLALQALLMDPLTVRNFADARAMMDELLAANARYLPQFFQ